jgi:hypothetical protein
VRLKSKLIGLYLAAVSVAVADPAFFESKIRPVLATKCYACHSSKMKAPMGELRLDTKAGLLQGGVNGAVVVAGKPEESRLFQALSYQDTHLQMPPSGKLPDAVIADFREWIASGATDPRVDTKTVTVAAYKGMSIEEGRKWWAFQPLRKKLSGENGIDGFVRAGLARSGLKPSPPADARTLVKRVYVDLVGFKPSYEEVERFAAKPTEEAYRQLVDELLASQHYGERWGRHWMDVARFGEDNPTNEATNPGFAYAWRYRDWIIEAMNKDVPYDRFVKLQLAADLMEGTAREDLRALGYLGAAPVYHKDLRLSEQVIGGFLADDLDERVDAVSRGLLGMTVACARCHDHKFDPIPTKDYYGLAGIFASTARSERPLFEVDAATEKRYVWLRNRLFDLHYLIKLLTDQPTTVTGAAERVEKWKVELEALKQEALSYQERYPKLTESLEKYWKFSKDEAEEKAGKAPNAPNAVPIWYRSNASAEPFMNVVYEAAQVVDGSDAQVTMIHYKPGEARDFPVLRAGNYASPGEMTPRHFPRVLAQGEAEFKQGSGRLELAERIFTDAAALAARVIVNRVWGWHFGRPLVATASDFGVQGEKPTHPELLDYLASELIAHGWSLKWLHREILLSATYQQSSKPRPEGMKADAGNALIWRMNARRMEVEAYRDTLLRVSGRLDRRMYGKPEELQAATNLRRTVYGRVSRGRMNTLLKTYDFPDPMQTAGGRELTISPLQQLFVMNSEFLHGAAEALAGSVKAEETPQAAVRLLFRKVLSRDPTPVEMDRALSLLNGGTMEQLAQVLLATNEEIFWP